MRLRLLAFGAAGLLLLMIALGGMAAYSVTSHPYQAHHNLEIPIASYGRLWVFTNPCTSRSGGSIEITFQRPVINVARPGVIYDTGTYRIIQDAIDNSFTPLASIPTAPECE